MTRTLKRRPLDKLQTLRAFECRMMCLEHDEFKPLMGKWLESFDIFQTYLADDDEINRRYNNSHLDAHIFRLAHVLNERGIPFQGITSARTLKRKRIACIPSTDEVVYVGTHNSFLKKDPNIFSLSPQDKRYTKGAGDASSAASWKKIFCTKQNVGNPT